MFGRNKLSKEDLEALNSIKEKNRIEQEKIEREKRITRVLTTDPWDFDLIKKIAQETEYNFDLINQATGQILRFYKKDNRVEEINKLHDDAIKEGIW